jgi:hypothetical protein
MDRIDTEYPEAQLASGWEARSRGGGMGIELFEWRHSVALVLLLELPVGFATTATSAASPLRLVYLKALAMPAGAAWHMSP